MVRSGFSLWNAAAASSQYCLPSPVVELCHIVSVTEPSSAASVPPVVQPVNASAPSVMALTPAAHPLRIFMLCSPLHRVLLRHPYPICCRRHQMCCTYSDTPTAIMSIDIDNVFSP